MKISGVLFLMILIAGCSGIGKPLDFDYGSVENGKYTNSFFAFETEMPEGWYVQTREQMDELMEMGQEMVAGDDKNMKAVLKASEINSANLLSVFKYEVGAPVEYNPNFMMVAENVASSPGIKNGSDYLFQSRLLMKQAQMEYENIDEEFAQVMVNGQEFYTMNLTINYLGLGIHQVYYATIINDFALCAIISFVDEEQKGELEQILQTMKFNL